MSALTEEEQALLAKCVAKVGCEEPYQCLLVPYLEFLRSTGLAEEQGQLAWALLCRTTYPWQQHIRLATELKDDDIWISTGDLEVDKCLGGGIRLGSMVEVSGESASGKTQLCIQLAISAQLPEAYGGLDGDVIYISTEGPFPVNRLESMVYPLVHRVCGEDYANAVDPADFMHRIQVAEFENMETMFHAFDYKVPALLSTGNVRLMIVDSIAAHLRFNTSNDNSGQSLSAFYKERSDSLVSMGAKFKRWANEFNCAFVFINQVTDLFTGGNGNGGISARLRPGNSNDSDSSAELSSVADVDSEFATVVASKKAPALGSLWSNIIDTRIMMYQRRGLAPSEFRLASDAQNNAVDQATIEPPSHLLRTRRWIENVFSPWAPNALCEVVLDKSGFQHITNVNI
ncbi:DNA repair protein rhp57 [Coemansia spiralis]|uniref:DNA repair protein rhp57 n=1 Tax=Coemansia spiralis TaxID=417178 RepID=A0A9W8L2C7_9FUNG|nr:DNA repair protein rhp57 [Coemansia spiralis]